MVKIGMVGKTLIHNYPYAAWFNGTDEEVLQERCTKAWMLKLIEGRFPEPAAQNSRITHVWAGEREEAEAVAAGCLIPNVCDSAEEVIEAVDGLLVLDEEMDARTATVEAALEAGLPVFVDKVPAATPERTRELVDLAVERDLPLAAWSQLIFAPEAEPLRELEGGSALVTYRLAPEIVDVYGVHLVCSAFAAFGADPVGMSAIDNGPDGIPMMALRYEDGKDVVLRAGSDVPPHGSVAYIGADRGIVSVSLRDMAAMFDASAAALQSMFEDRERPLEPDAVVRMSEAVTLLCGA
jgi:hypothetical protein